MVQRSVVLPFLLAGAALAQAMPLDAQRPDSTRRDSIVQLPPISVTSRAAEPTHVVAAAVGVLDSAALRQGRRTAGLADALSDLPGTYVADRGHFALDQRISLRGFGSRSAFGTRGVMILLDGVPQTLPDGQSQFTNVDLDDIARVEVLRGSASALYGNGAGGVVSLQSAPAAPEPWAARARLEGGEAGYLKWSGWGSVRQGRWSGTGSLSRATVDGFRQHSSADLRRLGVQGEYRGSRVKLALRFHAADDPRADNPGALTQAEYAANPDSAAAANLRNGTGKAVSQQQGSLGLSHMDTAGTSYDLTLFGLHRNLDNPLASATDVRILRWAGGVRGSVTRRLGAAMSSPLMTAGFDAQWLRDDRANLQNVASGTPDTTLRQIESTAELGPFLRGSWQPSGRWGVDAGVRYDRVRFRVADRYLADGEDNSGARSMGAWSGSVAATYTGFAPLAPYASLSTSYETPTTTELAVQQSGAGGFNPSLGPQRAVNAEIGARGADGPVTWSLALFNAWIRDALVPYAQADGRSYYVNAGRIRNRGIELGATARVNAQWTLQGAWTFADYRFIDYVLVNGATSTDFGGHRLAGVPRSFLRLGMRGRIAGGWIAVTQTVASGLWADDANAIRADGWNSTDARLGYSLRTDGAAIAPFAGVSNLWNARYVASVTINGANGRVLEPSAPRTIYGGLEASW